MFYLLRVKILQSEILCNENILLYLKIKFRGSGSTTSNCWTQLLVSIWAEPGDRRKVSFFLFDFLLLKEMSLKKIINEYYFYFCPMFLFWNLIWSYPPPLPPVYMIYPWFSGWRRCRISSGLGAVESRSWIQEHRSQILSLEK